MTINTPSTENDKQSCELALFTSRDLLRTRNNFLFHTLKHFIQFNNLSAENKLVEFAHIVDSDEVATQHAHDFEMTSY